MELKLKDRHGKDIKAIFGGLRITGRAHMVKAIIGSAKLIEQRSFSLYRRRESV